MKECVYVATLLVASFASASDAAADYCPAGTQQTLNGTMSKGRQEGQVWNSVVEKFAPCEVVQVEGKGKVPDECASDYFMEISVTASGRVNADLILELTNIRGLSKRMK